MSRNRIERWDEVNGTHESQDRMAAFLENQNDCYAILQLRSDEDCALELFSSMSELQRMGKEPDIDHYEVVHLGNLPAHPTDREQVPTLLESLYETYNINRPEDFTGHSLSVSDVIALKLQGQISCHYVDSVGFQQLPDFIRRENYLKAAEMSVEDDYGMIDGIINNGRRQEDEERPSVLERLHSLEPEQAFPRPEINRDERERS